MKVVFVGVIAATAIGASLWWFVITYAAKPPAVVNLKADTELTTVNLGAKEFEAVELNGKELGTKAEYDTEKKVVANKVKNLDRNNVDWNELQDLSEDWDKVVKRENCKVETTNVKLPEDGWELITLTATAISNGTCK